MNNSRPDVPPADAADLADRVIGFMAERRAASLTAGLTRHFGHACVDYSVPANTVSVAINGCPPIVFGGNDVVLDTLSVASAFAVALIHASECNHAGRAGYEA